MKRHRVSVASAEATRTLLIQRVPSPHVPQNVVQRWNCCVRKKKKKKNTLFSVLVSEFLFQKKKKKKYTAFCLPTRHKGHNIFSMLSLYIFYSACCLFTSSLCSLTTLHITASRYATIQNACVLIYKYAVGMKVSLAR